MPKPAASKMEISPTVVVQSKTPHPAFRQAQAARAEKILRRVETAEAVKAVIKEELTVVPKMATAPKAKPVSPSPEPVPVPLLSKTAPRLLGPDKKECPNCTASVDIRNSRCRCGYEFPSTGTLMPSLAMSDDERAEFAKLFG